MEDEDDERASQRYASTSRFRNDVRADQEYAVKANLIGIILRRIMTDMDVTIVATAPRFLTKDEIARLYFEIPTDRITRRCA